MSSFSFNITLLFQRYVPDFEEPMGAKNKCPWITINGKDIPDSQMTINYLSKELGKVIPKKIQEIDCAKLNLCNKQYSFIGH